MGLREELREKYKELDEIYSKLIKEIYEDGYSSNPYHTEYEIEKYNLVIGWLSDSLDSIVKAMDNIPYPY